ncbi:MAG: flavodoxin-dependent (E)-4-hydroxy-3-methylbut-2-enyl-diphosphate synthase [Eubacteriales bacterium]
MSKKIMIGDVAVGGKNPVVIQSMTNTKTSDIEASMQQISDLEQAGCELIRLSAPDEASAKAFKTLKSKATVPLIADIHFDYKLAVLAIENGADKIRINPGNIGDDTRVKAVVDAAKAAHIPIRVGVNGGSMEKEILKEYGNTAKGLTESAINSVRRLEKMGFYDMIVSIKSSSVQKTIASNRLLAEAMGYPIHIGVTEAGTYDSAVIKSAAAFAPLLLEGIGDTIRVSISGEPVREVYAAKKILSAIGIRQFGVEIISCPTCARTDIDVEKLANAVELALKDYDKPLTIAVMGCAVNGPGEAKEADIGVAGGKGEGLIFVKGEKVMKVKEADLLETLVRYIKENF